MIDQCHGDFLFSINRRFEGGLKWQEHCLCVPGFLSAGSGFCVESDTFYPHHIWDTPVCGPGTKLLLGAWKIPASLPGLHCSHLSCTLPSDLTRSFTWPKSNHGTDCSIARELTWPKAFRRFISVNPPNWPTPCQGLTKTKQGRAGWDPGVVPVFIFSRATTPLLPATKMTSVSRSISLSCKPRNKHGFDAFAFFLKPLSDWRRPYESLSPVPWSPASQALSCWPEEEEDILKDFFMKRWGRVGIRQSPSKSAKNKGSCLFIYFYPGANSYLSRQHICFASFISPSKLLPRPQNEKGHKK